MSQSIEQKLAQTAAETVKEGYSKEYRNACESLPSLLLQSGLLPTLAYLEAATQAPLKQLGRDLTFHLHKLGVGKDVNAVVEALYKAPSVDYQTYFELALKAAVWQKRIAKARISKDETNNGDPCKDDTTREAYGDGN